MSGCHGEFRSFVEVIMKGFDIHPDMHHYLEASEQVPWTEDDLEANRQLWQSFCLNYNQPCPSTIQVENLTIPLEGADIPVRIYRPAAGIEPMPAVVYLHGGGWVLGTLDSNDSIAWGLAEGAGAVVISVDYRLSPEYPYPIPFQDCFGVVSYLSLQAASFGIDPRRIGVAGDSAGGNLSAAISLKARDQGHPTIAVQALIFPVLDTDIDLPSYIENRDAPGLTRADMIYYLNAYLGEEWSAADQYAMPARAADLTNLPPTLIHTAEIDPLRDEGKLFADRLAAADVEVSYRCAQRMTHSFIRARLQGESAAAEFAVITEFLRKQL